jgi:predicted acylesterase/phospholipase RssA
MSNGNYMAATKKCDIVMKGGVTSGIVYPRAVSRLAREYRFQSIGGTSAGAIAAAVTAAAEYSRARGTIVFDELNRIPAWLGGSSSSGRGSNLLSLFQPQAEMRGLFRVVLALLVKSWWLRSLGLICTLWSDLLIGCIPGLLVALLAADRYRKIGILLGMLIAIAGAVVSAVLGIVLRISRVPRHGFGLCTGYAIPHPRRPPALTEWLNNLINSLSGHNRSEPLTFGDLRRHDVTLRVVATCLTFGRPYTLPLESGEFYFFPDEMRRYFPPEVVSWMEEHASTTSNHGETVDSAGLKPLPAADDLPVIVAVRMSLSFPLLFCAVPLYAVDWTRRRRSPNEPLAEVRVPGDALEPDEPRRPEAVWFSDGGICSIFPLHLFDAPLPRWPTFALDLDDVRPDREGDLSRVWMPTTNRGGIALRWTRLNRQTLTGALAFLGSIVDAARNWTDNLQTMVPGYRDRIAHIYLDKKQGGLNLNMSAPAIDQIAGYGECAGEKLIDRFVRGVDNGHETDMTWENHRWVRYRSTMAVLGQFLARFNSAFGYSEGSDQSYLNLIGRGSKAPPGSYRLTPAQQACAQRISPELCELGERFETCEMDVGAPRPEPALRIRPQF